MNVSAIVTPKLFVRASNDRDFDIRRKFHKKIDRIKVFQKKISDDRKSNISEIAKEIDDLVKSEIAKSKSLIDDHMNFFKQEWEADAQCEGFKPQSPPCGKVEQREEDDFDEEDDFE